jgi:hypothetical protein
LTAPTYGESYGEGKVQGVVKATQTGILWSLVQVQVGPPKSKKFLSAMAGVFSFYEMTNSDKTLLTFIKIDSLNDLNFLPTLVTFVL